MFETSPASAQEALLSAESTLEKVAAGLQESANQHRTAAQASLKEAEDLEALARQVRAALNGAALLVLDSRVGATPLIAEHLSPAPGPANKRKATRYDQLGSGPSEMPETLRALTPKPKAFDHHALKYSADYISAALPQVGEFRVNDVLDKLVATQGLRLEEVSPVNAANAKANIATALCTFLLQSGSVRRVSRGLYARTTRLQARPSAPAGTSEPLRQAPAEQTVRTNIEAVKAVVPKRGVFKARQVLEALVAQQGLDLETLAPAERSKARDAVAARIAGSLVASGFVRKTAPGVYTRA